MKNFFAALFLTFITISCQNATTNTSNLLNYIPKDTPVIIKTDNLSLLKSEIKNNDFIKETKNTSFYNDLETLLKTTDYLKTKGEVLFCFNEIGKQNFEYALITKYKKDLLQTDSLKGKKIDTIAYDGAEIKKIIAKNITLFTTIIDGVLIVSSSQLFTENIIRQRNVKDLEVDETFYKLYKISDSKKSATIFINNNKIKIVSDIFFGNDSSKYIRDFADWTAIELSLSPDALTTTGIAMTNPPSLKTITIFNKTTPQENLTALLTPTNATGFISFTFDDHKQFHTNLSTYSNKRNSGRTTIKKDTIFKEINEIGLIFEGDNKNVIIRSTAIDDVRNVLINDDEPVSEFREIPIYKHNNTQLITEIFSPLITDAPITYYTFINDFIVFSEGMASIQNIITNHLNKTTLIYNKSYKGFISELSKEASVLMVGLQPGFKSSLQKALSADYKEDITTINFKNYPYFAFQVINDRNFSHITSVVKKTVMKNEANTITQSFSIILDANVALQPQFVINHRTKQKEIIVQDIKNTLYLISNKGKVLWKKRLDSYIQGKIQQVDLYKNGRLQLAFVTRNKLHIIDRNGNEVAPFPINFSNTITRPLAVFDYDKNKNYRFLVCQGKKLGMYNSEGKIVDGFTLAQTRSNILFTPKHFKIDTKDYLVIPEENGTLHILHRTGKTRIPVNRKIDFSENNIYLYNNKFTITDKAGKLIQIDQEGKITSQNLNLEQDHYIDATSKTLVTLSDNILTIKGKKVVLDFGLYTKPRIFYVNNKIYVAITDMQTRKVYVYDSNAVLLPHFPVYGMAEIDMDDIDIDKKPEFTVQGDKNVILLYKILKNRIIMNLKYYLPLIIIILTLSCKEEKQQQHKDHNKSNIHMNKIPFEDLAEGFENPDRTSWQKPDDVIAMLGDIKGKKIMDIGAGTGYFAFRMANKGATVIAADVDERFLKHIEDKKSAIADTLVVTRLVPYNDPRLNENEVDAVIIVDTYHHIEDRIPYFRKVLKGLKPGGQLMVVDFKKEETPHGPPLNHRLLSREVITELEKTGFTFIKNDTTTLPYQYIIIAKK